MPSTTTTTPREQALALLQTIDRNGAYTDAASADEDREPCSLAEAIRATATVVEGAMPAGNVPPELAELFSALALWAWDQEHAEAAIRHAYDLIRLAAAGFISRSPDLIPPATRPTSA
jgi:hypothetical protein